MKKLFFTALLSLGAGQSAIAGVDLVQVPVACGTIDEVSALLNLKMEQSAMIGKGNNSKDQDVAVLFSGSGRWALVTRYSPTRVCVVASGHSWTPVEPAKVNAFRRTSMELP
jgi:hypothetical protein